MYATSMGVKLQPYDHGRRKNDGLTLSANLPTVGGKIACFY